MPGVGLDLVSIQASVLTAVRQTVGGLGTGMSTITDIGPDIGVLTWDSGTRRMDIGCGGRV